MISSTATRKAMVTRAVDARPACYDAPQLFQHPLLEEPQAPSTLSADDRRATAALARQAEEKCLGCPLLVACLYDAVVRHDVAGYVAGTTHRQRLEMRTRLGVHVDAEDLDTLAGVTTANRQINREEVVRLRRANPHESLETIAYRLGCSLSTVKRHLRKARTESPAATPTALPTREQVVAAYREVVTRAKPRATRVA